jgi:hypothetical protein
MSVSEQADGKGQNRRERDDMKKRHRRKERHKAKQRPEIDPGYRRFRGYLT